MLVIQRVQFPMDPTSRVVLRGPWGAPLSQPRGGSLHARTGKFIPDRRCRTTVLVRWYLRVIMLAGHINTGHMLFGPKRISNSVWDRVFLAMTRTKTNRQLPILPVTVVDDTGSLEQDVDDRRCHHHCQPPTTHRPPPLPPPPLPPPLATQIKPGQCGQPSQVQVAN